MNGLITDYVAKNWLATFLSNTWMALFTADPQTSGAIQSEVVGGAYKRLPVTFEHHADSRIVWMTTKLVWTGMPAVVLSHVGVCDAHVNGNLLSASLLPPPYPVVRQGSSFILDQYTYAISIGLPSVS
jgi:hypothetical protein